ncbi:hypothetical protein [Paenibacillus xylaniclasticus]|uniref:hypothetical protein n=1 Tax=Paenibacillus xylaniclasticus TaxID=588083 RepID=UPI000FD7DA46|nr:MULTISPECIES: hypothetical protein [Paenibacillus]GFN30819.1 hypothetical protein PCURB6_10790 [Paenibacillus curdlanolyticus]
MSKITGFGFTLLFVSLSFMLFQFIVRKENNFDVLVGAGLLVLFYSAPYILLGGIVTYFLDKVISKEKQFIGYLITGGFISLLISILFNAYNQTETLVFVLFTTIVGAIIFYYGSGSNHHAMFFLVGFGIPIVLWFSYYLYRIILCNIAMEWRR